MKQKKVLTLMWRRLNFMEFGKDVILLPYYLGLAMGYRVEICCGYADELEKQVSKEEKADLKFIRRNLTYNPYQRTLVYLKYLFQNSLHIDLLMCFHWRLETFIIILYHRLFNKTGQIYVKLDTATGIEWDLSYRNFISKTLRKWVYKICLKKVNLLSCETLLGYQNLCGNEDFGAMLKQKLVMMPNSFDEPHLKELNMKERSYSQKENLMITVGRLGTHQKNTEMLLNALANMNLERWKFCFIGPVEESFQTLVSDFFSRYPEKKECVEFVGPQYDKKILWEYYNRAKVFVCTSRWESSGIVFNEAKRFRNYIVSTQVGEAVDLIEERKYGVFIGQEDVLGLSDVLADIVNGRRCVDVYQDYDTKQLSYQNNVKVLVDFLQR